MTYTLYGRPRSGSLTVEFLLEEVGASYERKLVTGYRDRIRPPGFAEIDPLRQVPALVLDDGSAMTESVAIPMWLAETHGDGTRSPAANAPERIARLRWMSYMAAALCPASMQIVHPENYTDEPSHRDGIVARARRVPSHNRSVVRDAMAGRGYIVGERIAAADLYLAMFARWFAGMDGIGDAASMASFRDRVLARPAIAGVLARHESGDWT